MTRIETLRKLLALGDLHRSEIDLAMGGDKASIAQALSDLMRFGDVVVATGDHGMRVYRLTQQAQSKTYAEVAVVQTQLVEIINFPEESTCS